MTTDCILTQLETDESKEKAKALNIIACIAPLPLLNVPNDADASHTRARETVAAIERPCQVACLLYVATADAKPVCLETMNSVAANFLRWAKMKLGSDCSSKGGEV